MTACSSDDMAEMDGASADSRPSDGEGGNLEDVTNQDDSPEAQKTRAYVDAYLNRADSLIAEGKLDEAKSQVLNALAIDDKNAQATAKLEQVNGLLGEGKAAQDLADEVIVHKTAMRAKQVAEVNDRYTGALQAYNNSELEDARKQLEMARLVIDYDAYQTDFGANLGNVKRLLREVQRSIDRDADARDRARYEDAYRRLKADEERDQARRTERIRAMMVEGYEAFERQDFDQSEHVAQNVLELAPSFRHAKDLVEMSRQARHATWRESYFKKRREQIQHWKNDIRDSQIPWTQIIQFPSRSKWDEITRFRTNDDAVSQALEDSELTAALKNKLSSEHVTWDFEDMTFERSHHLYP